MKDSNATLYMVMFVLIYFKIIDFAHLEFLDVCILVLFAIMVGIQIYNRFWR